MFLEGLSFVESARVNVGRMVRRSVRKERSVREEVVRWGGMGRMVEAWKWGCSVRSCLPLEGVR
jgi:hypothetical protein